MHTRRKTFLKGNFNYVNSFAGHKTKKRCYNFQNLTVFDAKFQKSAGITSR